LKLKAIGILLGFQALTMEVVGEWRGRWVARRR